MAYWIVNITLTFLLCVLCAGFLIPQILLIAFKRELFDEPNERKIHHLPIPRLGGLAFKPVIFTSLAFLLGANLALGYEGIALAFGSELKTFAFLFSGIMVLYLIGLADDLIGIQYRAKFVVQILCGGFLVAGGVTLGELHGILGIYALPSWVAAILTIVVVIFIINAVNLIDGVDGLASGLCSCALVVYGTIFLLKGFYAYALLSFATLGVLMPFFYYNVYGSPEKRKKIFMGDTGSLTVGLLLCFLALKLSATVDAEDLGCNSFVVAFAPLIIPCFDVMRVFFGRIRKRKSPFEPDKTHIHHKFLDLGWRHRPVMFFILFLSALTIFCNICLSTWMNITVLIGLDLGVWIGFNLWLTRCIRKRNEQNGN